MQYLILSIIIIKNTLVVIDLDIENKLIQKSVTPTAMRIRVYEILERYKVGLSLAEMEQACGNLWIGLLYIEH